MKYICFKTKTGWRLTVHVPIFDGWSGEFASWEKARDFAIEVHRRVGKAEGKEIGKEEGNGYV